MLLRFEFTDATRRELKGCLSAGLADKTVAQIVADLAELAAQVRHVSRVRAESDPQARQEASEVLDKRLGAVRNALATFRPHQLADAVLDAWLDYRREPRTVEIVERLVDAEKALAAMLERPHMETPSGRPLHLDERDLVHGVARILLTHGVRPTRYEPAAGTVKWGRGGGAFARVLRVLAPAVLDRAAPSDLKPWLEFVPKSTPDAVARARADAISRRNVEALAAQKDLALLRRGVARQRAEYRRAVARTRKGVKTRRK